MRDPHLTFYLVIPPQIIIFLEHYFKHRLGASDERVGCRFAERAGRRAGLRTGWQAGQSMTHERASHRAGLRSSQMAGLSTAPGESRRTAVPI